MSHQIPTPMDSSRTDRSVRVSFSQSPVRTLIACGVISASLFMGCQSGRITAASPGPSGPQSRIVAQPLSRAEIEQQQRAGTVVDTIQLKTTTISLRVGESYNLFSLAPVARDAAGNEVKPFSPVFVRRSSVVYTLSQGIDLRATSPGVDSFYVEALPRSSARLPQRPSTLVRIVVRP